MALQALIQKRSEYLISWNAASKFYFLLLPVDRFVLGLHIGQSSSL